MWGRSGHKAPGPAHGSWNLLPPLPRSGSVRDTMRAVRTLTRAVRSCHGNGICAYQLDGRQYSTLTPRRDAFTSTKLQLPPRLPLAVVKRQPARALSSNVRDEYDALVRNGTLTMDEGQRKLADIFDGLHQRVVSRERMSALFAGLAVWRSRGSDSNLRSFADFVHSNVFRWFSRSTPPSVYALPTRCLQLV